MRRHSAVHFAVVTIAALGLTLGGCKKGKEETKDPSASTDPTPAPSANAKKDDNKDDKGDKAKDAPPPPPAPPPAGGGGGAGPVDPTFERFANAGADNQIDVPKDWTHKPQGDSLLIQSPDKAIFIELSASLAMGKDKADEKKLLARLAKSLDKPKRVSPITKAQQNGLVGWKFAGTATKGGKPYDWESFALEDPAGKGAFGLVYASTADLVSHRAVIDKILNSISVVTK